MLAAITSPFFREVAMTEMLYCYCCRVHHPKDQMRRFPTKQGLRWRCLRSIEAAACPTPERDAFGRRQTEINKAESRLMAENSARLRHELDLIYA